MTRSIHLFFSFLINVVVTFIFIKLYVILEY